MAQTKLIDAIATRMKIVMTPQTKSINQKRPHKILNLHPQKSFKMEKPRLHWSPMILATQNKVSYLTPKHYRTNETKCKGYPSVAWQQQMETIHIERYNKMR